MTDQPTPSEKSSLNTEEKILREMIAQNKMTSESLKIQRAIRTRVNFFFVMAIIGLCLWVLFALVNPNALN